MYSGRREINGNSFLSRYVLLNNELLFFTSVLMKKPLISDFVLICYSFSFYSISFKVPRILPSQGLLERKTSLCCPISSNIFKITETFIASLHVWWVYEFTRIYLMLILSIRMGAPFPIVSFPNQKPRLLKWDNFLSLMLFSVKENQASKIR